MIRTDCQPGHRNKFQSGSGSSLFNPCILRLRHRESCAPTVTDLQTYTLQQTLHLVSKPDTSVSFNWVISSIDGRGVILLAKHIYQLRSL